MHCIGGSLKSILLLHVDVITVGNNLLLCGKFVLELSNPVIFLFFQMAVLNLGKFGESNSAILCKVLVQNFQIS